LEYVDNILRGEQLTPSVPKTSADATKKIKASDFIFLIPEFNLGLNTE
jgi:hypothetical protein